MKLGVNIDHVAVLREARKVNDPDVLMAMYEAILGGADQITIHLREDSRHINRLDMMNIIANSRVPVNVECSVCEQIIDQVSFGKPLRATIVPENRQELTTEGGLSMDLINLPGSVQNLQKNGIEVSLFIDPNLDTIKGAKELGVGCIELHTGAYANAFSMLYSNLSLSKDSIKQLEISRGELLEHLNDELCRLKKACRFATDIGLKVAAGHGLNYQNVANISEIKEIFELNIGQSIVARSVFVGLKRAVKDMKELIR